MADIENFTPLSRSVTSDRLATLIGSWVANCKEIIESHEGMIDKYLGDGFFAYWRGDPHTTKSVAAALNDAVRKVEAASQEKMAGLTAGLPLPPGFKLPF